MMDLAVAWGCCIRTASMMDLAERGCPALGSSSVRRRAVTPSAVTSSAVPQTISHAPLAAFTSVPGPHGLQVAGGGGEGDGGGGLGDGWPLGSRVIAKPAMAAPVMKLVPMSPVTWLGVGG